MDHPASADRPGFIEESDPILSILADNGRIFARTAACATP
jgi:hypothetical protein